MSGRAIDFLELRSEVKSDWQTCLIYLESLKPAGHDSLILLPLCQWAVVMVHVLQLRQGLVHNVVVVIAQVLKCCNWVRNFGATINRV